MFQKYIAVFLFLLIAAAGAAQNKKFRTANGEWTIVPYVSNVVKLVFQPTNYTTNENITNAVISKPRQRIAVIKIAQSDNTIILERGNTVAITADTFAGGYNGFTIKLTEGEKIFGGGERALPLDRRGYKFPLYNNPWYGYSNGADALNFSVPFFTSSNGYGLFFDNASKGYADIGKTDSSVFEAGFSSGELNVYVIFGKDYKEILSSYYKLTGTQPLPPRWALGNFMSRFGYTSEAQTKEIAGKMKQENIPFDAIIFDLFWFGDSIKRTMGNLDWVNKTAWPDPKKMIRDFKKQNINTVLIAEPFVLENTKQYNFAKKYFTVDSAGKPFQLTDFYFGYGGLLDIFRKDAGNWIWNNHYKKQIANGVNAWWTDLGEPEKHPSSMMHNVKGLGVNRKMGADEVHNIYGHYWNKMLFENYAKEFPNERLFHLNRSGFAGSQRYSIFPWSGDVSRSWSGLQAQIPLMLGMSMSGIPYIHADAGGFAGGEGDNELYVRWLQFAVFTPIFRPHGTALFEKDTAAYSFPSEPALIDTAYREYAKSAVRLRYSMLPYNYTLAYKQTSKGEPLVAPLYYYYPKDTAAVNVNDEFMWGENILVAPVLEKGAAERKVYLPEGKWYNFDLHEGSVYNGNNWIKQRLTLFRIPIYVKEGSFIPGNYINPSEYGKGSPDILYYPSEQISNGTLYQDDGSSKKGNSAIITFTGVSRKGKLIYDIKTNNKAYYKSEKKEILAIGSIIPIDPSQIHPSGNVNVQGVRIVGAENESGEQKPLYYIMFEFDGTPVHLEIDTDEKEIN